MNKRIPTQLKKGKGSTGLWILLPILGVIAYLAGKQTLINYRLRKFGKCTKAYVYSRHHIGTKGKVETSYLFRWGNREYQGSSNFDDKYRLHANRFKTDEDLITGDSICIVFLESNPELNKSNSFLEKDCACEGQAN